ncbi:MAG TPA: redoxin domain-containing protein [Pirellulales bacterium]
MSTRLRDRTGSSRWPRLLLGFVVGLSAAAELAFAAELALAGEGAQAAEAAKPTLGAVGDFSLQDLHGQTVTQKHYRGCRAVVLFFLGTECPVSNGYAPTMTELDRRYKKQGVIVEGVYSEPSVTREAARAHAKEYSLDFPISLDPEQVLARQAGITITPEAVVLAADGKVLYRGRIDNRYSPEGKRRLEATRHDLDAAISAVLAGQTPPAVSTPAFGCPLPKRRAAPSQ